VSLMAHGMAMVALGGSRRGGAVDEPPSELRTEARTGPGMRLTTQRTASSSSAAATTPRWAAFRTAERLAKRVIVTEHQRLAMRCDHSVCKR